jgi:hypothetical protein
MYAQRTYSKRDYSSTLRPVNWIALGINFVFIVLHYFQTMFFYDAIAQDIPSWDGAICGGIDAHRLFWAWRINGVVCSSARKLAFAKPLRMDYANITVTSSVSL